MFDAHAHVAFSHFDKDRDEVITRAREAGMTGWLEIGTDIPQSKRAIALAEKEEGVYASVGVHPTDAHTITPEIWEEVKTLAQHPQVKAVGEVGLDFYHKDNFEQQKDVAMRFMHLAHELDLPIIFHVRSGVDHDAHDEMLYLLSRFEPGDRPVGIVHTFSGTADQARKYLEFGSYISFSGVLTFANAGQIVDAALWAPLDRILIETDCPFLAPAPYRGKRNEPAYVKLVAEKLGEIRKLPASEIIARTEKNARRVLKITA